MKVQTKDAENISVLKNVAVIQTDRPSRGPITTVTLTNHKMETVSQWRTYLRLFLISDQHAAYRFTDVDLVLCVT